MTRSGTGETGWRPLLLVALLAAAIGATMAADPVAVTTASGQVRIAKRDIGCALPDGAGRQPLGALLAEPGGESLYPYALGLNAIVADGDRGYALTTATRAFATGPLRAGGDVLLAGIDRQFNPLWATVFGGPAPDGPSSLTRTADGGRAGASSSAAWPGGTAATPAS